MKTILEKTFNQLMHHFGQQNWWPAENDIEMMVGAVLVQNTNWVNVEKALANFSHPLNGYDLLEIPTSTLSEMIRPAGFYTRKSATIRLLIEWYQTYDFKSDNLSHLETSKIRSQLLEIRGIGKETADCILLYAFNRPVFIVDAYLKRLLRKLNITYPENDDALQHEIMNTIYPDTILYQEIHAVIVEYGKHYLKKERSDDPLLFPVDLITIPYEVYFDVLSREPEFKIIHDTTGFISRVAHPDPYTGFIYTITGQFLSASAAQAIFTRFIRQFPTVKSVAKSTHDMLVSTSLSNAKAKTIFNLCTAVYTGQFDFESIKTMNDCDAINAITQFYGLGQWSAIVILIHTYNRLNLSSYDDIALRKSATRILNTQSLTRSEFDTYLSRFEPYKTVASLFLWKLNKVKD